MNVLCANVGNKYLGYTERLYRSLVNNTRHPFNFICITDSPYPGWWSKQSHFPLKERCLLIDVDMVITGNVDFLFEYEGEFCLRRNPWAGAWCDGSLVVMSAEAGNRAYAPFIEDPAKAMRDFRSDQEMVASVVSTADTWQDIAPGKTASYKADNLGNGPGDAAIITFHGEPKPHQLPLEHWVWRYWK